MLMSSWTRSALILCVCTKCYKGWQLSTVIAALSAAAKTYSSRKDNCQQTSWRPPKAL
jgi:hypothetical protein